ncbi:MAG: ammonium transporter, partial [archaeon]|nr:ammonium transporter [archaeon]
GIYVDGPAGLLFGQVDLFVGMIASVLLTIVFCFVVSYAIVWILSKFMEIRVSEMEEIIGQDLVEHGEPSYDQ